jgi:hypothetical protein
MPRQKEISVKNDERCCGSGTCIIDAKGCCWCGQQWDGEKMVHKPLAKLPEPDALPAPVEPPVPGS